MIKNIANNRQLNCVVNVRRRNAMSTAHNSSSNNISPDSALSEPISKSLEKNELIIRNIFKNCYDIVFRRIQIYGEFSILLVYLDGLADTKAVDNILLKPWMLENPRPELGGVKLNRFYVRTTAGF